MSLALSACPHHCATLPPLNLTSPSSQSSVCVSVREEISGLFSLSLWTLGSMGRDLRLKVHPQTIFTLIHVRGISVLVGHE